MAEPAPAPRQGNPHFPLIDSMRALAALSVLLFHVFVFSHGSEVAWYRPYTARLDIGVTIFFVISGFLLYRPFVDARVNSRLRQSFVAYARKRLLRILPAFWLALTVLTIYYLGVGGLFEPRSLANFVFLSEYIETPRVLPQSWSLDVEASFYLLLPLIAAVPAVGSTRMARLRWELALLMGLLLLNVCYRLALGGGGSGSPYALDERTAYSNLIGSLDWFVLGMGLAVTTIALEGRSRQPALVRLVDRFPAACWLTAGVLMIAAAPLGVVPTFPDDFSGGQRLSGHAFYGLIALLVLLPAVLDVRRGLLSAALGSRALRWLGTISYGIFLWHLWLVTELTGGRQTAFNDASPLTLIAVVLPLSVLLASASYYLLERPFLRLKYDRPRPDDDETASQRRLSPSRV